MALAEKTFNDGEVIIKEGDIGKSFFRLLKGKASVYADYAKKEPFRLAVLEEGEYFGEMAIIEEYPRSATIVAKGHVTVVEIPEDDLNEYFEQNPDQIYELMKHLGRRVETMTRDYNEAKALLKEVSESDAAKNKSLFSKIKKHINLYQYNKNRLTEPADDTKEEASSESVDDGTGNVRNYGKGLIIFKEGAAEDCLYILHQGRVGFYTDFRRREEVKVDEASAVTIFGEMGMFTGEARTVTAVAETDARVETICPEDLEALFKTSPAKVALILRRLSYKVRKLNSDFLYACKDITETYNEK